MNVSADVFLPGIYVFRYQIFDIICFSGRPLALLCRFFFAVHRYAFDTHFRVGAVFVSGFLPVPCLLIFFNIFIKILPRSPACRQWQRGPPGRPSGSPRRPSGSPSRITPSRPRGSGAGASLRTPFPTRKPHFSSLNKTHRQATLGKKNKVSHSHAAV